MMGKIFNNNLHFVIGDILTEGAKSNSSTESITDSKYELKVFAILMFLVKISPFSFKTIFESPKECLLEKYGLQLL